MTDKPKDETLVRISPKMLERIYALLQTYRKGDALDWESAWPECDEVVKHLQTTYGMKP